MVVDTCNLTYSDHPTALQPRATVQDSIFKKKKISQYGPEKKNAYRLIFRPRDIQLNKDGKTVSTCPCLKQHILDPILHTDTRVIQL